MPAPLEASGVRPRTRLRELRTARGLSQQEVAQRCGLTRQAVGAIEAGRYVPNTGVALALARCLGVRVEDVFALPDEAVRVPLDVVAGRASGEGRRVALASVRGRLVGHPLGAGREVQGGFLEADALLRAERGRPLAEMIGPLRTLDRTALLLGCDPALGIVRAHVERRNPDVRLRCLPATSRAALEHLRAGNAHVAGTHLHDPATGTHNLPHARRALSETGGLLVRFASWEQGLVVAPGNPKRIRDVGDLARPGVRFVNRDAGSGGRVLLDELLRRGGIPPQRVRGYERTVTSHLAAAAAVAAGAADAALALPAAAEAHGLSFVPLALAHFDLALPRDLVAHPAIATLLDVLAGDALRRDLKSLAGYEVAECGAVVAEVPARV